MRTFSLNSDTAHALLCRREDRPWIPNGALRQEPRWGERSDPLSVWVEDDGDGADAASRWLQHVEAGTIGGPAVERPKPR